MSIINHNGELIPIKELVMIERVLHYYGIEVHSASKVKSVYKVSTNVGMICLKCTRHGKGKIQNGVYLEKVLNANNFNNISKYIKTPKGDYAVRYGKHLFYAAKWIEGEPCCLDNLSDVQECFSLLAKLHKTFDQVDSRELNLKQNFVNLPKTFYDYLLDLESYKDYINNKIIKNHFDRLYYEYVDSFYVRGATALSILNNCNYFQVIRKAREKKSICHNKFYLHNLIKTEKGTYIDSLESVTIDLQINDLAKFLRRLMSKEQYRWDFNKALKLIESYSNIRPLEKEELGILLALTIFPYKFWKLGKKRYKKHKDWNEGKYMKKLNKLLKYYNEEQKFAEDFMKYLSDLIIVDNRL